MTSAMATDLLERTFLKLEELRDPAFAAGVSKFFKEPVTARGVRSPQLIELSREIYLEIKPWPVRTRDQFVTELWKDPHMEGGALACYVYRKFAKTFSEREFRLFERWLDRYANNWGHCDGLSVYLLAPAIAHGPELAHELPAWTQSKNQWKRRAAAVALVKEGKRGRHTELIFEIATALACDPEDLVQKGAGWLLKETYPAKPREVVKFLRERGEQWPRLVLRYAAEKMTSEDKRAVLSWEN
jgi:3-methyladenine DNA glycosylase AlkD